MRHPVERDDITQLMHDAYVEPVDRDDSWPCESPLDSRLQYVGKWRSASTGREAAPPEDVVQLRLVPLGHPGGVLSCRGGLLMMLHEAENIEKEWRLADEKG